METLIAQMISDAEVTLAALLRAGYELATNETRLLIDPVVAGVPSNYRGYQLGEFDLLSVDLPHGNRGCRFDLVIRTHARSLARQTYVVLAGGSELLRVVHPQWPTSELTPVAPETVTELAAQIHSAKPAP